MRLVTGDWNPLGNDCFYRKFELCSLRWKDEASVNLANCFVAAAPFCGCIALIRDDKSNNKNIDARQEISVYTPFGCLISTFKVDHLTQFGWSFDEELLCIQEDGSVLMYDIFGIFQHTFVIDQEVRDTRVFACKLFNHDRVTGIALITFANKLLVINNVKDPKPRYYPIIPGVDLMKCVWAVVACDGQQQTKIIISSETKLYLLKLDSCVELFWSVKSPFESVTNIAVSFDGRQISILTNNGILWIGRFFANELKKNCEFETNSKVKPHYLVWCGEEAVAGLWKNLLLLVGKDKDWLNFVIDPPVHIVEEIDGIRIIGNDVHEFIQQVPPVVVDVFRIGSVSAGALLLEATKEYHKRTHKADEYMKMLTDRQEIESAVVQCIKTAGHEYSVSTQKMLLRAASFGKFFLPEMDPKSFVTMCQTLRVLNAVRHHNIGIPLSYEQLQYLSINSLIQRLVLRRHYCVAIRIAKYLKIPEEIGEKQILTNWAYYKVRQTHVDDFQIAKEIADKLGFSTGVSYSDIANKAIDCGRNFLAIKLLDNELKATEQVLLLLKLREYQQAMQRAVESGDVDLVYSVIDRLKNPGVMHYRDFLLIVRNFPIAYNLYKKFCKRESPDKLKDLYDQEDDFGAQGFCWLSASYKSSKIEDRQSFLHSASEAFRKARNDFMHSQTEEQMKLLKNQSMMEEKFHQKFVDLSVHQTIKKLIQEKEYKLAEELKKECKVPDKRYWWLKITVLAEQDHWLELEKFSKLKKSPIGYEPFVDVCLKRNNKYEANKYVSKVREENKVKYLVKLGQLEEAAKIAFELKDEELLSNIESKVVTNRALKERIENMRQQLTRR